MTTPVLTISGLTTTFRTAAGTVKAVDDLHLTVREGETLAVVGESGCGKSVTAYSIMRLVRPPGTIVSGSIVFEGTDLLSLGDEEMRRLRGDRISMIFQEPMTSLNPVFRIGEQIAEAIALHRRLSHAEASREAVEMLRLVSIPAPERRYADYPHQLSGGMRQRVMIAMALACRPRLLIADEPTTALDVTIQAQILELIHLLKEERKMSLILITHDLGVVAEHAHRTAVMYAGRIVELAPTAELFASPRHPYTAMLLESLPQRNVPGTPLAVMQGVPQPMSGACALAPRCQLQDWRCLSESPDLLELSPGHFVRCWKC